MEYGADVNNLDRNNGTFLHSAADGGHFKVIKELMNLKADINARNKTEYTDFLLAASKLHTGAVKILVIDDAEHFRKQLGKVIINCSTVKKDVSPSTPPYPLHV